MLTHLGVDRSGAGDDNKSCGEAWYNGLNEAVGAARHPNPQYTAVHCSICTKRQRNLDEHPLLPTFKVCDECMPHYQKELW